MTEPARHRTDVLDLPVVRLRFRLEARQPVRLPSYPGFALRGAFGRALRRLACTRGPDTPCGRCPLRRACPYARLYEPFAGRRQPYLAGEPTAPHPYLFDPVGDFSMQGTAGPRAPGDEVAFHLLLLGEVGELAPYARLAVERMGETGLGAARQPFELIAAEAEVGPGRWVPYDGTSPTPYRAGGRGPELPEGEAVRLRFETPLRLVSGGEPVCEPDVVEIVGRAARRHLAVEHLFGGAPRPREEEIEDLEHRAREVRAEVGRLTWVDLHRYSGRQRRRHPMGGLVGEVVLRGELEPLLPTLRAAEELHVGKGTSFGLGRVRVVGGADPKLP